jgi:hypothetical protein
MLFAISNTGRKDIPPKRVRYTRLRVICQHSGVYARQARLTLNEKRKIFTFRIRINA